MIEGFDDGGPAIGLTVGAGDLLGLVPRHAESELAWSGPERLLLAILEQALADLADRDDRVRAEARAWFHGDGPVGGGFGFDQVADVLGLDVDDVRQRLGRLAGGASARRAGSRIAWSTGRRRAGLRAAEAA